MKIAKLITLFICLQFSLSAQTVLSNIPVTGKTIASFIPKGYDTIQVAKGDLNKDAVEDIAIALKHVDEDSAEMDEEPKRLILVLLYQNGEYKLAGKSENALMCLHCGGVFGDPFAGIEIAKGILFIYHYGGSAWRWSYIEKFRYQQDGFYLIGSTSDYFWTVSDCNGNGVGDAGRIFKDTNWLTGAEEIIERSEECKLIKHIKHKLPKKPLIKLEAFEHE